VDDHAVVRRGLKAILAEEFSSAELGEAENAQEALQRIREQEWDLILLDIAMPGRSGLEVLKQLNSSHPALPVLVLSMYPEEQYAVRVLRSGAAGYLTKEGAPEELVQAARKVLSGGRYVGATLAEKLALRLSGGGEDQPHASLSDREFQVMCMIASGKTVSQIADELSLSVKTISTFRARILEKMSMATNTELVRYALENRLIT